MRFLIAFLVLQFNVYAQIGTGQWRLHVPNRKAIDVVSYDNLVFAAFENGMLEYDTDAEETSIWTDVNGLSDINLTCLGYYPSQKAIYIGYDNGNIDKIVDNAVINIPAIRLAQIQGNKRINKIVPYQGFIYFATSFSIVKIDPVKNEVKEAFYPTTTSMPILDIAFRGDSIYALTTDRLLRGNVNNIALTDPSQWVQDNRVDVLSAQSYKDLEIIDNQMYLLFQNSNYGQDTIYHITDSGAELVTSDALEIYSISSFEDKLVANCDGSVFFYNSDYSHFRDITSFSLGSWISPQNCWTNNGTTWIADQSLGLIKVINDFSMSVVSFEGPPKKDFYSMDWNSGKLAIVGGGLTSIAATFNRSGVYLFENEEWSLRDDSNMSLWTGQNIWDYLCIAINPTNSSEIAVGTYSELPVSIMDASGQVVDTFTQNNSTLQVSGFGSSSSMITSMQYDNSGNLWVLNGYTDSPLNVYTSDGNWYAFDCGIAAKNKFSKKLIVDYEGNKWISIEGAGVFGYNDNGTISTASDDKVVHLNTGESTGALPSNSVNALAVDFDNEIWIGTDNGFAVLYNSSSAFDASAGNYNAQRIKVEYEGNVEYVLGNTNVIDIEVDGANRKWIGTANSGIILLSADGLEVIQQFTTDNSPIISDNIIDLELDQSTGELFIITDKGLVSYRTDATYEDPEYANVTVFPNPAHPDFEGPITIQGIRYNSDIKITDIAGNLVYQTTSNGGTATWDGKTISGEKVVTGVYLIWTAANEGKGRKVGKVLVVH